MIEEVTEQDPPKKYKVSQQVLADFASTVDAKPNLTAGELLQKFPEFGGDQKFLQSAMDYYSTSKSGKYKTLGELNSKFPEFDFSEKKNPLPTDAGNSSNGLSKPSDVTGGSQYLSDPNEVFSFQKFAQPEDNTVKIAANRVENQTKKQKPSIQNNFGFPTARELQASQQPSQDNTINRMPEQTLASNDEKFNHEKNAEKRKLEADKITKATPLALNDAARKSLTIRGIKAEENSPVFKNEVNNFLREVSTGDAKVVFDKDGKPGLQRTSGFFDNIVSHFKGALKGNEEADKFANMTDAERVDFLNKKQQESTPSPYISERPNLLGEAGGFLGDNAPFIGKAALGTVVGGALAAAAPETGGVTAAALPKVMSFIFTAHDAASQAKLGGVTSRFYNIKHQHPEMSDIDAMAEARKGEDLDMAAGIATNALLMESGAESLKPIGGGSATAAALKNLLKSSVSGARKITGVDITKDLIQGDKTPEQIAEDAAHTFVDQVATLGMLHIATGAASNVLKLPNILKSAINYDLSKENPEMVKTILDINEAAGNIPLGTASKVMSDIEQTKNAANSAVPGLDTESQASVAGLIRKRTNLENEAKGKDETAQPYYKEQIDAVNEQIKKIQNTNQPFEHEIDEATGKTFSNTAEPKSVTDNTPSEVKVEGEVKSEGENKFAVPNILNEDNSINLGKVKQYAADIEQGTRRIERLSPAEEQGRTAGGTRNVEASIIANANEGADSNAGSKEKQEVALTDSLEKNISDLFDKATTEKNSTNIKSSIDIADVTPDEATKIKELTGLDVSGFTHTLDNSAINHIIKHHGSETELLRGQEPVTKDDFAKIPEIISNPDKVEYLGKNKIGRDVIRYTKRFNGHTYYLSEVRTGKKELAADTLYKTKSKGDEHNAENNVLPKALTSETASPDANVQTNPEPTRQEKINNLIDLSQKHNKARKNSTTQIKLANEIKIKAAELGLTVEHKKSVGYIEVKSETGKKLQKKNAETNLSLSDSYKPENYSEETHAHIEEVKNGVYDLDGINIIGFDKRKLSRKQTQQSLADLKEGKVTHAVKGVYDAIENAQKTGIIEMRDYDDPSGMVHQVPFDEYKNAFTHTAEDNQAAATINDPNEIIKSEGLTLENIDDHKHLFNGFPFEQQDFENVKTVLNETRQSIGEPEGGQQGTTGGIDQNKTTGTESEIQGAPAPQGDGGGSAGQVQPEGEAGKTPPAEEAPLGKVEEGEAFKSKVKISTTLEEAKTKPISVHDIAKFINEVFDVPIRKGLVRWGQKVGIYKTVSEVIRVKNTNDIGTLSHELAHHIDKKFFNKSFPFKEELKVLDYDQNKKRPFEGFAEFVRKWMTGDGDLTKEAPKFLDYWENDFLKNNKEVSEKIKTIKKYVDIWRQQGSMLRILGTINREGKNPKPETEFSSKGKIITNHIDSNYPLKELVNKVLDLQGRTRKEYESDPAWKGKDPHLIAGVVAKTSGAKAKAWVLDGPSDFSGNNTGKSLKEIIHPVRSDIDKAVAYVISLRRLDRHKKYGVEYTKNDIEDAQYVVDLYKNNKGFNDFSKEITEWNRLPIEYLVDSGAMTPELAQKVINSDAFYIPLRALTESNDVQKPGKAKGLSNTGKTIGRFGDTGGNIVDPLESMVQNVERIIAVADKSRVIHALLNITEGVHGVGKIIEEIPAPMQAMRGSLESMKTQLEKAGVDLTDADMDSFLTMYSSGGKNSNLPENILSLYRNGKLKFYQVDPVLYKSLAGLDNSLINFAGTPIGKAAMFVTKVIRMGSTGSRAGFQLISNPFRDLFTGIMQTRGNAAKVPIDNAKAIIEIARGHKSDILRRYKASGVEMSTPLGADRRNVQGLVSKAISDPAQRKIMNIAMHPLEALKKLYDGYIDAISFPESLPRLAEYKKIFKKYDGLIEEAKKSGDYKKVKELEIARQVDASDAANEITLNFKKAGIQAAIINQFAFGYNPAIRGLAKMSDLLTHSPIKTITRGVVSLTLPSLALYLLNKDEDWYKNLPEWEKHGFFHFKIGNDIIRLPKPFEWGWAFSTLPETTIQSYDDKDISHIKDGFISGTTVLPSMPIPDIVKPAMQTYFDWDLFRDRAITPKSEADLLPELQYGKYTSPSAKKLGEILGVSPRKIDYLISGYTGGMGSEILNALPKEYKEKTDIPIVGRLFVRKSSTIENGQYTQDFYDIYNRASTLKKSQNAIKKGTKDNILSLNDKDKWIVENKHYIDNVAHKLSSLRLKFAEIEKSNISTELKEKMLDAIGDAQFLAVKNFLEIEKKALKHSK